MRRRHLLVIAIGIFLFYSGLIEPNWIRVRTYDVAVEGLPAEEITVVHIADVHTTKMGRREVRTMETVNRIFPDYVFFTGDLLRAQSDIEVGLAFLSKLNAKYGVYAVLGNADENLITAIEHGLVGKEASNYRVLMNESADCGSFTLVGIDDPVRRRDDVEEAFAGVDRSKPIFALTHFHPDRLLSRMDRIGVDIVFSGHTHGGQTGLTALVGLVPYAYRSEYIAGLYRLDGSWLHVTRGIGTNKFPLRFLCRPEIDVFHITGR
jgi:predicted MPP superfamily phosphohydrolase